MPQHKVAKAIKELDALRSDIKEDRVLNSGLIETAMEGGQVVESLLGQMKAFQLRHDEELLEAARIGERLGKELLKHV